MPKRTEARPVKGSDRDLTLIVSAFLAMIVFMVFFPTLRADFLNYDDDEYVYGNPKITGGLSVYAIKWAFTHVHASNWHPLTTISHMLDCQIYGLQPWGHHLTNLLLHALATVVLFLAIYRLTSPPNSKQSTLNYQPSTIWPSAFVAALFAIHPLRVESVAWVAERKDVLSGVFFALTLLAYAKYARANRRRFGNYLWVLFFFVLGLLCKPTVVTMPFVLLLLDYWPLNRGQKSEVTGQKVWTGLVVEKIPLFLLSAGSCVITVIAQKIAFTAMEQLPFQQRFANAVVAYLIYLEQSIWPAKLAVLYPYPVTGIAAITVVLALVLLWIISIACFLRRKQEPYLIVGWLWFLGMLVPMIGLVQVGAQTRADRYTYLPAIGLYVAVTFGFIALKTRFRLNQRAVAAIGLIVIGALGLRAYFQTSYWHDSETLWRHAIETTSKSHVAEDSLGNALFERGNVDEAISHYQTALAIKPDFPQAHSNLGNALLRRGQADEAIAHLRTAIQYDPNYAEAYNNLGGAFLKKGQLNEARGYFERAIQINPSYAEPYNNLGVTLLEIGDIDGAIAQYQKAVAAKPPTAEILCNLGNAYARKSDWNDAIAAYQKALRTRPDYAQAHNNLGVALKALGKLTEALDQFGEAVQINSEYAEAQFNFGATLAQFGKRDEAVRHLNEALRLRPDYPEARKGLDDLEGRN